MNNNNNSNNKNCEVPSVSSQPILCKSCGSRIPKSKSNKGKRQQESFDADEMDAVLKDTLCDICIISKEECAGYPGSSSGYCGYSSQSFYSKGIRDYYIDDPELELEVQLLTNPGGRVLPKLLEE